MKTREQKIKEIQELEIAVSKLEGNVNMFPRKLQLLRKLQKLRNQI